MGAFSQDKVAGMASVETVRGPVDTSELGRTLMHEHIFVLTPEVQVNFPQEWGSEESRVADAVAKLKAAAAQGTRTIVDPTVIGLGRYIPRIVTIAEQVPELNIIVATGCYTYDTVPFYFHYRGPALAAAVGIDVPDPMVDMFVADITEGIAGTRVKAAFLKCAIDEYGMTPDVARIMRAVAQAHRRTGAPITIHTHPTSHTGLEVKKLLAEEGVDPTRVVLGHSGDSTDADHLSELADAGFILGMDRFGIHAGGATFEKRCDIVVEMCRRGYADQMVLSHDAACYIDWIDPNVIALMDQWNYLHIGQDVLPYLLDHGVTEEQIETMLVANPRRYFERTEPY
jgi:phosphotriesterase-related protein